MIVVFLLSLKNHIERSIQLDILGCKVQLLAIILHRRSGRNPQLPCTPKERPRARCTARARIRDLDGLNSPSHDTGQVSRLLDGISHGQLSRLRAQRTCRLGRELPGDIRDRDGRERSKTASKRGKSFKIDKDGFDAQLSMKDSVFKVSVAVSRTFRPAAQRARFKCRDGRGVGF